MRRLRIYLANIGLRRPLYPLATPPMGIMYLAAYLRQQFDVDLKLCNQKLDNLSNEDLAREAIDFKADVVGFGAITPTAQGLGEITRMVRQGLPDALILVGGPHVSSYGPAALDGTEADAAVAGEGEVALEAIIRAHFGGGSLADVPGIYRRLEDGTTTVNPGSIPLIKDLDELPFPAYDLIDVRKYWRRQSMPPIPYRKYVTLFSSRGCPYKCNYCHDVFGKRFRQHSAERVVDEVEFFQKQYGVDDFEFVDDIFNLNPKRMFDFCDLVHKRNLKIKLAFPNGVRTDIFTEDGIDALVGAGMYFSSYALESGSPRIQQIMGKELDIPRFLQGVAWAAKRGVYTNGFSMIGFPYETAADMQMTIDVACESKLHTISFFTVTPFPGTKLYDVCRERFPERLARLNYDELTYSTAMINFSDEPDEVLFKYQRKANARFFLNPRRMYRMLRDYPKPHLLPLYAPMFFARLTKGIFQPAKPRCLPEEQAINHELRPPLAQPSVRETV